MNEQCEATPSPAGGCEARPGADKDQIESLFRKFEAVADQEKTVTQASNESNESNESDGSSGFKDKDSDSQTSGNPPCYLQDAAARYRFTPPREDLNTSWTSIPRAVRASHHDLKAATPETGVKAFLKRLVIKLEKALS